jgi:hypothetical protein
VLLYALFAVQVLVFRIQYGNYYWGACSPFSFVDRFFPEYCGALFFFPTLPLSIFAWLAGVD